MAEVVGVVGVGVAQEQRAGQGLEPVEGCRGPLEAARAVLAGQGPELVEGYRGPLKAVRAARAGQGLTENDR